MLAEIHHKISNNGSNLSDRLEDKLTGDFFGTIRYLPFEDGLRQVLLKARFQTDIHKEQWYQFLDSVRGYNVDLIFWPSHEEGEIDLLLKHPDTYIGIEVKYLSSLSSEDEESEILIKPEDSKNQLARYARMLTDISESRAKFLIFLAPYNILYRVERLMREQQVILDGVMLGFLGWQDILEALQQIDIRVLPPWQKLIIGDLLDLLKKKRFLRYKGLAASLLQTELTGDAYTFHKHDSQHRFYKWPTAEIEKESGYVYRKQQG